MIELYGREECGSCIRVKTELIARNISFKEYYLDKDITRDDFIAKFPGRNILPVIVTESGEIFSGTTEIIPMLNEYKSDAGKELLTEDRVDIGRFVNEGGFDQLKKDR